MLKDENKTHERLEKESKKKYGFNHKVGGVAVTPHFSKFVNNTYKSEYST